MEKLCELMSYRYVIGLHLLTRSTDNPRLNIISTVTATKRSHDRVHIPSLANSKRVLSGFMHSKLIMI